ncbi:MAG: hypothetical protein OHK93_007487 [Ramalina farinacea]|uniref:MIP18 family-like domain-containing protein n=1 Tax=Ramalina farinacea TaxID=258253 RepID=A0AA43QNY9_9LECA|nr:hypothetical protein [Ramalina farinacea]
MSEILNANPTIRNASDLPSRRPDSTIPTSSSGASQRYPPLGLFASTIPASAYLPDPFATATPSSPTSSISEEDSAPEPIDAQEIYDLIAPIADPEHPLTLGSLSVVNLPDIFLEPLSPGSPLTVLTVLITPTITHCSLATVIGLGVRVRLEQALPPRFRVDVRIKEGTHSTAEQVNRQLGDKERVAAALENGTLMGVLRKMLQGAEGGETAL